MTVPDEEALAWHFPRHVGEVEEFGCPLLRLVVLVGCGTRKPLSNEAAIAELLPYAARDVASSSE
ncbi:hypothetical protein [Streptomyces sp. HUAS ZL42]|uniref:hypothetical protein n=1 Tax=Streptomyces sp. HUAS ZL42 TaxID=3231715 RepID=UPI00345E59E5